VTVGLTAGDDADGVATAAGFGMSTSTAPRTHPAAFNPAGEGSDQLTILALRERHIDAPAVEFGEQANSRRRTVRATGTNGVWIFGQPCVELVASQR